MKCRKNRELTIWSYSGSRLPFTGYRALNFDHAEYDRASKYFAW
jgi:hypothetical protein